MLHFVGCATAEVFGARRVRVGKRGSGTEASRVTGGGGNFQLPTTAALQRQRSRM